MSNAWLDDNQWGGQAPALAKTLQQSQYIPATKRQYLQQLKDLHEAQLAKINAALDALDSHPELEKFIDVIQQAG